MTIDNLYLEQLSDLETLANEEVEITNLQGNSNLLSPSKISNRNKSIGRKDTQKNLNNTVGSKGLTTNKSVSSLLAGDSSSRAKTPARGMSRGGTQAKLDTTPKMKRDNTKGRLNESKAGEDTLSKNGSKPNLNDKKAPAKITIIKTAESTDKKPDLGNISDILQSNDQAGDKILNEDRPSLVPQDITLDTPVKINLAEVLDDRWGLFSKYFNQKDNIKFISVNKNFGKLSISPLISELEKELPEVELKTKALKEKYSGDELVKEIPAFALTRGALRAIDLLNENLYNKIFQDSVVPNDDILLTYRILFQMLKRKEFIMIKDNQEFWKKVCEFFINEGQGKTGTLINSLIKDIDFSDENINKLTNLVGNDVFKITPTYFSKFCGTTGLVIFLIKDAFEYAGIFIEKKTLPSRLYKNANYQENLIKNKINHIKRVQNKFFS